jgi:hypothetical protein
VEEPLYVWITTRRLKPGTYEEFSEAWQPEEIPEGMLQAFEFYAADRNEIVGISMWDSPEARERYRLSDVEVRRRKAMAPYVLEERAGFYVGRELKAAGPRGALAGERTIALGRRIAAELFEYRRRTAFAGDDERVFCSPTKGTAFDITRFAKAFRPALERSGISDHVRRFHDLRHTSITSAAAAGTGPAALWRVPATRTSRRPRPTSTWLARRSGRRQSAWRGACGAQPVRNSSTKLGFRHLIRQRPRNRPVFKTA